MGVFTVSHSGQRRDQEAREKAWRYLVGPELLGTRQGVGKVGGQRLGTGL